MIVAIIRAVDTTIFRKGKERPSPRLYYGRDAIATVIQTEDDHAVFARHL